MNLLKAWYWIKLRTVEFTVAFIYGYYGGRFSSQYYNLWRNYTRDAELGANDRSLFWLEDNDWVACDYVKWN